MPTSDPQMTGNELAQARADATGAYTPHLARAIRAHITAVTRRSFPDATGLMIYFPDLRTHAELTAKIASVVAEPPTPLASCRYLWDNPDVWAIRAPAPTLPTGDPWYKAVHTIEPLAEEYARLTRAHDWPWCDSEGEWRLLLFSNDT